MSQSNSEGNVQRKRGAANKPVARSANKLARTSIAGREMVADNGAVVSTTNDVQVQVLDEPIKSESDKKSYRVIKLPNGLQALLISDPSPIEPKETPTAASAATADDDDKEGDDASGSDGESESDADDGASNNGDGDDDAADDDNKEKLAACSLLIDVGSFSDPADIQGLSHFLEHMIFMGSAKFPAENEFDRYIKKCGGSDNAHTNCEETQFYFEAGEEHLDGAMDRFASLFREPLMHKEAMQREREAVESEFTSKRNDDTVRREQLLASLGRPPHPCSTFTWGNLRSLRDTVPGGDDALYERVHAFRRRHYSAHRMYVCVQARMPLDVLQSMVLRHWSDMPNNGLDGDDFGAHADYRTAFVEEFSSRLFVVKPVANLLRLELSFCLPALLGKYRSKPAHFVSYLVGHEGEGSLCAYLRKKLYALDLVAGIEEAGFETNSLYTLFSVSVHLTPIGLQNVREVHAAVLAYIRFLQVAGPQERLFRELQTIEATSFRFRTDQQPMDNVEDYAANMKLYPAALLFTGDSLYLDYEPQHIADVLDILNDAATPLNVMLTTRTMPAELAKQLFDRTEPWFGTEYAQVAFPEGWSALRAQPRVFAEFALPAPNEYITTDFTILYKAGESPAVPQQPQRLLNTAVSELWYRQDDRFLLPVAYYYFYLQTPAFRGSTTNYVLANLLPMLLKFRVIERLYPATIAGLGYDCYSSEKGLVLRISGYNQQLHRIVESIAATLRTFADELTEVEFHTFVEQKLRDYYNTIIKPKTFAKALRLNVIEEQVAPTLEKFERLKTVTLAEFRAFATAMLAEMRVQALMQGNITSDEATAIMQRFVGTLRNGPVRVLTSLDLRTNQLPDGPPRYVRYLNMNASDANTVTVSYYQLGPISLRLNCLLDLLLLIAEEPCFDVLRSKEQLGYDVGCTLRDNYGVLGYSVSIVSQETKHSAEHCDRRIEAFRAGHLADHVANMTDEVFAEFRDTLVRLKLTDDIHLRDELNRNWAEVTTDEYMFNRQRREVHCLQQIGREEFVAFYAKHCAVNATPKLCVQVIGNAKAKVDEDQQIVEMEPRSIFETTFEEPTVDPFVDGPADAVLIDDLAEFRCGLQAYPVCVTSESIE